MIYLIGFFVVVILILLVIGIQTAAAFIEAAFENEILDVENHNTPWVIGGKNGKKV